MGLDWVGDGRGVLTRIRTFQLWLAIHVFKIKILPVHYGLSYIVFILKVCSRLRLQQDSSETSILSVNFTWDHALECSLS